MAYYLCIEISGLPPTPNNTTKRFRRTLRQKELLSKITEKVKCFPDKPLTKAKLTLTRFSCNQPDPDGLVGSFKWIVDALVKCKILVDDTYSVIKMPTYKWCKAERGEGKTQIIVEGR